MEIKNILVVGAGTMGSQIAQCIAENNIGVFLFDSSGEIARNALSKIRERLQKSIDSAQNMQEILARITVIEDIQQAKSADFVIEAIVEDLETKKFLFAKLGKIFSNNIVLASNTSSISIREISESTDYPERVAGMHFFNPAHKMKLVEVVRGEKTSEDTIRTIKALAEFIGKTPVEVNDRPGFIVNRLLIPMINEAVILLEENIADRDSIDTAMKLGAGHPMGPLALADLIGIDVCLHIMKNLEKRLNDSKYKPCEMLKKMVKENKLGRKTKQGFYKYDK
ncbi:MAG: 3-hydroxyacyl-CoA dehydrogenase family protein [Candidatus Omnitrophica bacterium]|nr:3-hydroxyacyl-CoA dehydrogenase family protein [Candidatus Omnitrophota bacterium]MCM8828527.1 3-hydroxyacyl-CoA dehydrogenase family protein [Candidatus Omnitrophota bacterium]